MTLVNLATMLPDNLTISTTLVLKNAETPRLEKDASFIVLLLLSLMLSSILEKHHTARRLHIHTPRDTLLRNLNQQIAFA